MTPPSQLDLLHFRFIIYIYNVGARFLIPFPFQKGWIKKKNHYYDEAFVRERPLPCMLPWRWFTIE